VDFAAVFFDQLGVTLDHATDLLALVRVNQKDDFVMTHECSLRVVACQQKVVRQGVNDSFFLAEAKAHARLPSRQGATF
jgi:hypothetical protein